MFQNVACLAELGASLQSSSPNVVIMSNWANTPPFPHVNVHRNGQKPKSSPTPRAPHLPEMYVLFRLRKLQQHGWRSTKLAKEWSALQRQAVRSASTAASSSNSSDLNWTLSPKREVLLVDRENWHPFGRSPARNLGEGIESSAVSVLVLGGAEIQSVLETCRKNDKPNKALSFVVNDFNPSLVARGRVILEICRKIDPENTADLEFLWGVWFSCQLSYKQHDRLKELVKDVLNKPEGDSLGFLKGTWENLEPVMHSWVLDQKQLPSLESIKLARNAKIKTYLIQSGLGEFDWQGRMDNLLNDSILDNLRDEKSKNLVISEKAYFLEHGASQFDGSDVVNPTLIQHGLSDWQVDVTSSPYAPFQHFLTEEMIRKSGSLIGPCMQLLSRWVHAFQEKVKIGGRCSVVFHSGDPFELCSSQNGLGKFDAIDTCHLADNAGLLNTIVCAFPKMKLKQQARLITRTNARLNLKKTYLDYVREVLGMEVAWLPTLLGVKLKHTFGLDKYHPDGYQGKEKVLEWSSIARPVTPVTVREKALLNSGKNGNLEPLEKAILGMVQQCCALPLVVQGGGDNGALMSTLMTFSRLANNSKGRVQVAKADGTGYTTLTEILPNLCVEHNACFELNSRVAKSLLDGSEILRFHARLQWNQGSQIVGTNFNVKPRTLRVLLLKMEKKDGYLFNLPDLGTESLDKALNSANEVISTLGQINESMGGNRSGDEVTRKVQIVDNIKYNDQGDLCFCLPVDHGLDLTQWCAMVMHLDYLVPLTQAMPLSSFDCEKVAPPSVNDDVEIRVTPQAPFLVRVWEHLNEFRVQVKAPKRLKGFQVQGSKEFGCDNVYLGFTKPYRTMANVGFTTPIQFMNFRDERDEEKGIVTSIFPKEEWKLDVSSLPTWPTSMDLEFALLKMFNLQEKVYKLAEESVQGGEGYSYDASYELRSSLSRLFIAMQDGYMLHTVNKYSDKDAVAELVIIGHPPIRIVNGEPVMLVTFSDEDEISRFIKQGELTDLKADAHFNVMYKGFGKQLGHHPVLVTPNELEMLRKLLNENVGRTVPSKAQVDHYLKVGVEWHASHIGMIYADDPVAGIVGSPALKEKVQSLSSSQNLGQIIRDLRESASRMQQE